MGFTPARSTEGEDHVLVQLTVERDIAKRLNQEGQPYTGQQRAACKRKPIGSPATYMQGKQSR